jgi:hypothetical protein
MKTRIQARIENLHSHGWPRNADNRRTFTGVKVSNTSRLVRAEAGRVS